MLVPGSSTPLLAHSAAAAATGISRSLRFNSSDSAYLSRTPASAGNRKTWTWAGWVKRSGTGAVLDHIFLGSLVTDAEGIRFNSSDKIQFYLNGGSFAANLITTQVFRDFSAWYHIVVAVDTTQATASNRVKLYINGSQITAFDTSTYPSQNYDCPAINTTAVHWIGANIAGPFYSNFYLADCYLIDGSALTPSSFTETDATTGQLIPKAYTGSYGTNGFHLEFADNSSNTATTLGKDTSGNGNNWTPTNFSVTAGAGNDSLVDTPTSYGTDDGLGGSVRGNYATLNPLAKGTTQTLLNGNLDVSPSGHGTTNATIAVTAGSKVYIEFTRTGGTEGGGWGFTSNLTPYSSYPGTPSNVWWVYDNGGNFSYHNNGSSTEYGSKTTNGQTLQLAIDYDAGKAWIGINNTWFTTSNATTGNPGTGANPTFTFTTSLPLFPLVEAAGWTVSCNFGQRPFAYTAPSGFKALCDTNLPTPVVAKPNTVMDVALWTGNSTNGRAITGLAFQPDFVWIKRRSASYSNLLFDAVRGFGGTGWTKQLISDSTAAEDTGTTNTISSFDTGGFTLGTDGGVNLSGSTYVAWTWDAGSSSASPNNDGTVTSTVKVNATAGFSIVTWTYGNAPTVGHGLGAAPSLIIAKSRTVAVDWVVYHRSLGKDKLLVLNDTGAEISSSNYWGSSEPSSTVFGTIGNNTNSNNRGDMVAYCFAPVAGYSSFGQFIGNGDANGPFVYTGFRPRWVMIKPLYQYDGGGSTVASTAWYIYDSARGPYNANGAILGANNSYAEENNATDIDFLSNGFKLRNTRAINTSNGAIYAAFAEAPFQYARAR